MKSKTVDGVEIRTYSFKKDYTEERERKIAIGILALMLIFSFVFMGELNNGALTTHLIEKTGAFISSNF